MDKETQDKLIDQVVTLATETAEQVKSGKNPLTSKTVLINAGFVSLTVLGLLGVGPDVLNILATAGGAVGLAVANIALRFVTKEPISFT